MRALDLPKRTGADNGITKLDGHRDPEELGMGTGTENRIESSARSARAARARFLRGARGDALRAADGAARAALVLVPSSV